MIVIRTFNKFGKILTKHQKLRMIEIAVLMLIGGILEMCSISLIIPFMNAVLDPDALMEKWYAQFLCTLFHIDTARMLLILLAVMLAVLYILKNLYLLFEFNVQYRFVYKSMQAMQRRMLAGYMTRPYEFYLKVDSGEVIHIMNSDIPNAFNLLITLLSFLTETVVSLILILTIFALTPFITVCIATVLLAMMLFINAVIKPTLGRAGESSRSGLSKMNKWLIQSIQGIKEIKVTHRESYFQKKYSESGEIYIGSLRKRQILSVVPRFFIEAVSMSAMFVMIAIVIYNGSRLDTVVPIISAVAVAAVRLMPATNRMSAALGSIAYLEPTLNKVIENFTEFNEYDYKSNRKRERRGVIHSLDNEIALEDVSYRYPESDKNVLDHASMRIYKGQSVGIVGSSGAGKTTTVDLILGLLQMNSGQILVDGHDISEDMAGWYELIGYIPQSIFLMDDSIKRNVAFGMESDEINDEQIWRVLKEASLDTFVKSLPDGIDTEIGERGVRLSGGQRQRIGIARALYRNPEILIFDEATSALDNETEAAIMESIHSLQGQKTMIIIAHRLTTIENCDCIFRVDSQKIWKER